MTGKAEQAAIDAQLDRIERAEEIADTPVIIDQSKPIVEEDEDGNEIIIGHESASIE